MKSTFIQTENKITTESIEKLINDKEVALVIKNFCSHDTCEKLTDKILKSQNIQKYTHEVNENNEIKHKYYGVNRVGTPFNMTYNLTQNNLIEEYYINATKGIETIRAFCSPFLSPIDKLRLELDEIFIPGATVAYFENKKMLVGIGRIALPTHSHMSEEQPHFDALPLKYAHLEAQFAANIYLNVPSNGGELELWDTPSLSPLSKVPHNWRTQLPQSIKIKPQKGDLIIFNCRKPHAICSFTEEKRVTIQVFIGYQKGLPLMLWN